MAKTLNVAMIGYGFMGRTHSNAYKQVNDFFDLEYRPVLKVVCGRDADEAAKAFAEKWGYESIETDWRKLDRAQGHRRDRHLHARTTRTPRSRIAAAAAGKMILCEKPLAMDLVEARRWSRRSRRPASPTPSGTTTGASRPSPWPSSSSTRAGSAGSSTTAPTSSRTGRSPPTCPRGAQALWRLDEASAGSGVTGDLLAHCIDTALWLNGADHHGLGHDRDVHQGAQAQPDRARSSRSTIDDACRSSAGSTTARSACSSRPATPAATRPSTPSRSTARRPRSSGTSHDLHRLQYFDHGDDGHLRGWRSIHVTDGDIRT